MENSNLKSLTGQVELLYKTDKDFPQKLKHRLVRESSNSLTNHFQLVVHLYNEGLLCDESNDSEATVGLKEMMAQLALMIACSKGADAMGNLMNALEVTGNSQCILELGSWLKQDFGIEIDLEPSDPKEVASAAQTPTSEKLRIFEKTHEWLETSMRAIQDEPKPATQTFFDQAAPSDGLSNLATIKCQRKSATKGICHVQFDKERMMASSADGTLNMLNWQGDNEQPKKVASHVNEITCFQYDDEILILGTSEGSVYLFDMKTLQEKSWVRLGEPVIVLKFIESILLVITGSDDYDDYTFTRVEISRPDMPLLNTRSIRKWKGCKMNHVPGIFMNPYDDDAEATLSAPSIVTTLNVSDLVSTKRAVLAGCIDGMIAMWETVDFTRAQCPTKSFRGNQEAIVSLCFLHGHLLSLDKRGKLLMWSRYELESFHEPVPRVLIERSDIIHLAAHERWFATCSSKDDVINMWTLPDLWLRTG